MNDISPDHRHEQAQPAVGDASRVAEDFRSVLDEMMAAAASGTTDPDVLRNALAGAARRIAELQKELKPQSEVQYRTVTREQVAELAEVFVRCAEIYGTNQYTGPDGKVNPNDERYVAGGVHFERTPEWFSEQLQREGARLILAEEKGKVIGYSLFFTEPKHFPSFGDEAHRYSNVEGVEKIAFTYLFIVDSEHGGKGIAKKLMTDTIAECRIAGCDLLVHEFFVRPVVNLASANFHEKVLKPEFGAVDTGVTAIHTIESASGNRPSKIMYAHYVMPTSSDKQFLVSSDGSMRLERK